jgi:hypothetical protein
MPSLDIICERNHRSRFARLGVGLDLHRAAIPGLLPNLVGKLGAAEFPPPSSLRVGLDLHRVLLRRVIVI